MTDQPHENTSQAIVKHFLATGMPGRGKLLNVRHYITEILPVCLEEMHALAESLSSGVEVHGLPTREETDEYMGTYRQLAQALENFHKNQATKMDLDTFEDAAGIFKGFRNLIERLTNPLLRAPLSETDKQILQAKSEAICTEFDGFFHLFTQRFYHNRQPQIFDGIDQLERDSLQGRMASFLISSAPSAGYPSSHYPMSMFLERIIPEILKECSRIADSCLNALERDNCETPSSSHTAEEIAAYKANLSGFEQTFKTFAANLIAAVNGDEITPRMQAEIVGFRGDVEGLRRILTYANYLTHSFQLASPSIGEIDITDALISLSVHFNQSFWDILPLDNASWRWPIGPRDLAQTGEGRINAWLDTCLVFPSNSRQTPTFRELLQETVPQHLDAMDDRLEKLRDCPEVVDALPTAQEISVCKRGMERFTKALLSIRTHTTQPTDLTVIREGHAFLENYENIAHRFETILKNFELEPLTGPSGIDVSAFVVAISEHFDLEKAASSPPPQHKIQGGDTEPEGTLESNRISFRNLCYRFYNATVNTDGLDNPDTEFSISYFLENTLPFTLSQLKDYADAPEPLRMKKDELQYLTATLLGYVSAMHSIGDRPAEFLPLAGIICQLPETLHRIGVLLNKAPQRIDIDVPFVTKQLRSVTTCFEDIFSRYQDYTAANTFSRA